eukprot:Nk52_evm4s521 gene=Nk52_evmTU4s521
MVEEGDEEQGRVEEEVCGVMGEEEGEEVLVERLVEAVERRCSKGGGMESVWVWGECVCVCVEGEGRRREGWEREKEKRVVKEVWRRLGRDVEEEEEGREGGRRDAKEEEEEECGGVVMIPFVSDSEEEESGEPPGVGKRREEGDQEKRVGMHAGMRLQEWMGVLRRRKGGGEEAVGEEEEDIPLVEVYRGLLDSLGEVVSGAVGGGGGDGESWLYRVVEECIDVLGVWLEEVYQERGEGSMLLDASRHLQRVDVTCIRDELAMKYSNVTPNTGIDTAPPSFVSKRIVSLLTEMMEQLVNGLVVTRHPHGEEEEEEGVGCVGGKEYHLQEGLWWNTGRVLPHAHRCGDILGPLSLMLAVVPDYTIGRLLQFGCGGDDGEDEEQDEEEEKGEEEYERERNGYEGEFALRNKRVNHSGSMSRNRVAVSRLIVRLLIFLMPYPVMVKSQGHGHSQMSNLCHLVRHILFSPPSRSFQGIVLPEFCLAQHNLNRQAGSSPRKMLNGFLRLLRELMVSTHRNGSARGSSVVHLLHSHEVLRHCVLPYLCGYGSAQNRNRHTNESDGDRNLVVAVRVLWAVLMSSTTCTSLSGWCPDTGEPLKEDLEGDVLYQCMRLITHRNEMESKFIGKIFACIRMLIRRRMDPLQGQIRSGAVQCVADTMWSVVSAYLLGTWGAAKTPALVFARWMIVENVCECREWAIQICCCEMCGGTSGIHVELIDKLRVKSKELLPHLHQSCLARWFEQILACTLPVPVLDDQWHMETPVRFVNGILERWNGEVQGKRNGNALTRYVNSSWFLSMISVNYSFGSSPRCFVMQCVELGRISDWHSETFARHMASEFRRSQHSSGTVEVEMGVADTANSLRSFLLFALAVVLPTSTTLEATNLLHHFIYRLAYDDCLSVIHPNGNVVSHTGEHKNLLALMSTSRLCVRVVRICCALVQNGIAMDGRSFSVQEHYAWWKTVLLSQSTKQKDTMSYHHFIVQCVDNCCGEDDLGRVVLHVTQALSTAVKYRITSEAVKRSTKTKLGLIFKFGLYILQCVVEVMKCLVLSSQEAIMLSRDRIRHAEVAYVCCLAILDVIVVQYPPFSELDRKFQEDVEDISSVLIRLKRQISSAAVSFDSVSYEEGQRDMCKYIEILCLKINQWRRVD